ncbi:MAG: AAA family ATPase [Alphaproteobacteria bacterium]|jgi:class 3 adenylate cyclase|nr:AAA family ATPase [Alphaproteobacteria bacterium]MBT4083235.1 AAA family ATPase [Alphaproteobacteria bacterium]MBT7743826.1 AAA family ATPase [Alphaproteobacteria bacterium]
MHCSKCDAENKPGRKFCSECGAALVRVCQKCEFANEPDDRFCGGCGATLDEVPDDPPKSVKSDTSSPEPVSSEAERRQLTIMFCDLVGSTALSEAMDPEDLARLIANFQDSCTRAIKKYDGYVARLMGDGLLVYFGYPLAHEDDPERAVRAGLDIVEAVSLIPPAIPSTEKLSVRVGIATGLVVVGDLVGEASSSERAVVGETPNLAARIQGLAEPDTVVIAPSTRKMLGGIFAFTDLGTHELKGLTEPVRAWRVDGLHETGSRFEAYHGDNLTPLVGRSEEISFLQEKWQLAKSGEGQSVNLCGEAGIGKSRILEAIQTVVEKDNAPTLQFQCSPHHESTTLFPFIDFIGRAIRRDQSHDVHENLIALLTSANLDSDEASALIAKLLLLPDSNHYAPLKDDAQWQRNATLAVVADLIFGLAQNKPMLIVFEDAHWIDPTSLDLLGMLLDKTQSSSLLFLVTFRPEFTSPWQGMGHVALLNLNRISRSQCSQIVNNILAKEKIPQQILKHILEKTDGVPLYVEEMTKAIVSSGQLASIDGTSASVTISIPANLQDSLMARLDQLGSAKDVAQAGAVIGREFSPELLAAVAGLSDTELTSELDKLVEAELIFRRGWPPSQVYVFKHALVQDAAYSSLLRDKRRQVHKAVATALEAKIAAGGQTGPETLAFHLTECGEEARASVYWETAGRRSQEGLSHTEAAAHFGNALAGVGSDRDRELQLCLDLITSQRVLGVSEHTLKTLERAEPLAHADIDKANIFGQFGNVYFLSGESEKALASHEKALEITRRTPLPEFECRALSGLADVHYMRGHMVSGHHQAEECVATARKYDLHDVVINNLSALGNMKYLSQGPRIAREFHETNMSEVIKADQPRAEMIFSINMSSIFLDSLENEQALKNAQAAVAACERIDALVWLPLMRKQHLRVRHAMGEDVAAEMKEIATQAVETSSGLSGPWVLGALAQVATDPETVHNVLEQAEDIFAAGCVGHNQLWFYRDAIDGFLRFGLWDKATECADALDAFTANEPLIWNQFFAARGRALADHGRGQTSVDELKRIARLGEDLGFLHSLQAVQSALPD